LPNTRQDFFLNRPENMDLPSPFAALPFGPAISGNSRRETIWARVWKASPDLDLPPASRNALRAEAARYEVAS
jgi:hypothetical protein